MLRTKQPRVVITFHTTTAAMQAEALFRRLGQDGRLIPVPREITAGCGLAWSAPPACKQALTGLLAQESIAIEEVYELVI